MRQIRVEAVRCPFHPGNAAKKYGKASCRRAPARHSSLPKQFQERLRSQACGQERRILPLQKCGRPRLFLPSPLPFRPRRKRCGPTASGLSEGLPRKYEQVPFAPKLRRTRQSPVKNKAPGYGRPCRKKGMFGKQKGRRKEKDAPSKVERTREKDRAEARNGDGKISTPPLPAVRKRELRPPCCRETLKRQAKRMTRRSGTIRPSAFEHETAHGNAEHYAHEGTVHHEGRSSVADEGKRHAHHGHESHNHAYVHDDLPEKIEEYACGKR